MPGQLIILKKSSAKWRGLLKRDTPTNWKTEYILISVNLKSTENFLTELHCRPKTRFQELITVKTKKTEEISAFGNLLTGLKGQTRARSALPDHPSPSHLGQRRLAKGRSEEHTSELQSHVN